jgi:hypothetical protein
MLNILSVFDSHRDVRIGFLRTEDSVVRLLELVVVQYPDIQMYATYILHELVSNNSDLVVVIIKLRPHLFETLEKVHFIFVFILLW